eukprot:TRINITY_DN843_c0_g1_i2.p1 TRINITY_DN843_c0_g1~~TRINITY_DN843_c0_g1_i2.p1  ORF type:complete len:217 (-),score=51.63 TRINITY_DN843_c0_g1_i2:1149-1799(-)
MSFPTTSSNYQPVMGIDQRTPSSNMFMMLQHEEGKTTPPPTLVINVGSVAASAASQPVAAPQKRIAFAEGVSSASNSSGGSGISRVSSRPIAIAASVGAIGNPARFVAASAAAAIRDSDLSGDVEDYNGDDEKYRRLKMKYLTSLKVVRPSGHSSDRPSVTVSQSVPDGRFTLSSLRSEPIAIPEKTRRVDDFFYKSPADDATDQQDENCQFDLEL